MSTEYKEAKLLTRFDLGWTEDEYNDFIIDAFSEMKGVGKHAVKPICDEPKSVIITITQKDHYKP